MIDDTQDELNRLIAEEEQRELNRLVDEVGCELEVEKAKVSCAAFVHQTITFGQQCAITAEVVRVLAEAFNRHGESNP